MGGVGGLSWPACTQSVLLFHNSNPDEGLTLQHCTPLRYGYDMESLTNSPGVTQYQLNGGPKTMHTLSSVFKVMQAGNANPWLQVEQFMSESELLGMVEYLAAPFDPAKDSAASKPWAAKRCAQGQVTPYTDVFKAFMYEISNEEWNG